MAPDTNGGSASRPRSGPDHGAHLIGGVAVKMQSRGSVNGRDGAAGLERRSPTGTRGARRRARRDAARLKRRAHFGSPTSGMVLSFGAHRNPWDVPVPASRRGEPRHAACGPAGRVPVGDRRSRPLRPFSSPAGCAGGPDRGSIAACGRDAALKSGAPSRPDAVPGLREAAPAPGPSISRGRDVPPRLRRRGGVFGTTASTRCPAGPQTAPGTGSRRSFCRLRPGEPGRSEWRRPTVRAVVSHVPHVSVSSTPR